MMSEETTNKLKGQKSEKEKLEAERNELNALIERGAPIEVKRKVKVKAKGVKGILGKKINTTETLKFTIKEPTLAVLDAMGAEQLDIIIDELELKNKDIMSVARNLSGKHAKRLAKILAISVVGEDYYIAERRGGSTHYRADIKKINELTELFLSCIKPSKLLQYTMLINTISNLGDFMNSTRLMSANRTTMPTLVEESKQV